MSELWQLGGQKIGSPLYPSYVGFLQGQQEIVVLEGQQEIVVLEGQLPGVLAYSAICTV